MQKFTSAFANTLRASGLSEDEISYWKVAINDIRSIEKELSSGYCSSCKNEQLCRDRAIAPFPDDHCPAGKFDPR